MNLKCKAKSHFGCGSIHPLCVFIPLSFIAVAFVIRLFSGGTVMLYTAVGNKGLFPKSFFYTLGYCLRIFSQGFACAFVLTGKRVYENKIPCVLIHSLLCISLLFEYRLIFISFRLFTALLLCAIRCAGDLFSIYLLRYSCEKYLYPVLLACAVFDGVFFVQLLSLILCL